MAGNDRNNTDIDCDRFFPMMIEKLKKNLADDECALIMPGSNLFYLTNMQFTGVHERLFFLLVTKEGKPAIVAPRFYDAELKDWNGKLHLWRDGDDPIRIVRNLIKERNAEKMLVEDPLSRALCWR